MRYRLRPEELAPKFGFAATVVFAFGDVMSIEVSDTSGIAATVVLSSGERSADTFLVAHPKQMANEDTISPVPTKILFFIVGLLF
jgi:hypothetical protein